MSSHIRCFYDAARSNWALERPPGSDLEWFEAGLARWEDLEELGKGDPWLREPRTAEKLWEAISDGEGRLLDPQRSYCTVQRHVRIGDDGKKLQGFRTVHPIGCTRSFAWMAATTPEEPDRHRLFFMEIGSTAPPKGEIVRQREAQETRVADKDVELKAAAKFESAIEEVEPAWRALDCPDLPAVPETSCLHPGRAGKAPYGILAIAFADRAEAVVFLENPGELRRVPVPRASPDCIAVSATYFAAGYWNARGNLGDRAVDAPPHVYVCDLSDPTKRHGIYVSQDLRAPSVGPELRLHAMSALDFHQSRPHLLIVGVSDGGFRTVDCDSLVGEAHANDPDLERRGVTYLGPNLEEVYRAAASEAERTGDERALDRTPEPATGQSVWFVRWSDTDGGEDARTIVGLDRALIVINSTHERVAHKFSQLGKRPVLYAQRDASMISAEAAGGVLVVHDADSNGIVIADLAQMRPRWKMTHPDVLQTMQPTSRPYPSLRIFTRRIVVLWPNGFVGFIEAADDELVRRFESERQKLIEEKLARLSVRSPDA